MFPTTKFIHVVDISVHLIFRRLQQPLTSSSEITLTLIHHSKKLFSRLLIALSLYLSYFIIHIYLTFYSFSILLLQQTTIICPIQCSFFSRFGKSLFNTFTWDVASFCTFFQNQGLLQQCLFLCRLCVLCECLLCVFCVLCVL